MSYRTGQCLVGNHPLCAWEACTCGCHQPAQLPAGRFVGEGRSPSDPPPVAEDPGASQPVTRFVPCDDRDCPERVHFFRYGDATSTTGQRGHSEDVTEPVDTVLTAEVRGDAAVTVALSAEDFRFITEYDPERERSASRRDLVEVLAEIARLVRDNRVG